MVSSDWTDESVGKLVESSDGLMSDLRGFGIGRMAIATSFVAGWSKSLILIGTT